MRWLRRAISWRLPTRRLSACCVLLGYLATTIGMPMPTRGRKEGSQPFPCQDNPCGCQSAEQCWTACCCYTVEEHWTWARAHDIEPPSYAVRPADDGWSTTPQREREEGNLPCTGCSCCHASNPPEAPNKEETRWVSGMASLRCQGGQMLGSAAGTTVPPPSPSTWHPDFTVVGCLILFDVFPIQVMTDPVDPPPRPPCL